MWTDIATVQLSDNIKLEQLTPAALGGLMGTSYNEAFYAGQEVVLIIVRTWHEEQQHTR